MKNVGDLIPIGRNGNALASDLLQGKTATTDNGEITGTLPKISTVSSGRESTDYLTWDNGGIPSVALRIPLGAYLEEYPVGSGNTEIQIPQPNLKPENIKAGVDILGIIGNMQSLRIKTGAVFLPEASSGWSPYRVAGVGFRPRMVYFRGADLGSSNVLYVKGIPLMLDETYIWKRDSTAASWPLVDQFATTEDGFEFRHLFNQFEVEYRYIAVE